MKPQSVPPSSAALPQIEGSRQAPRTPAPHGFAELFAAAQQPERKPATQPARPPSSAESVRPSAQSQPIRPTGSGQDCVRAARPGTPARTDERKAEAAEAPQTDASADAAAEATETSDTGRASPPQRGGLKSRGAKSTEPLKAPLPDAQALIATEATDPLPAPEAVEADETSGEVPVEDPHPPLSAAATALPEAPSPTAAPTQAPQVHTALVAQTAPEAAHPIADKKAAAPVRAAPLRNPAAPGTANPGASKDEAPALAIETPVAKPVVRAQSALQTEAAAPLTPETKPAATPPPDLLQRIATQLAPPPTDSALRRVEGSAPATVLASGINTARTETSLPTALVATAVLSRAPGQAGFAQELGAQIAVWAKDGVQQAQLLLNPAELGPVRVQIQIEGQQAQLQFAAEHPLTREALQQGLGQLAQSLQQDGLSLGRSDVQSQWQGGSQGQTRDDGRAATRWDGPPDDETPMLAPRQRPGASGLLDLYA